MEIRIRTLAALALLLAACGGETPAPAPSPVPAPPPAPVASAATPGGSRLAEARELAQGILGMCGADSPLQGGKPLLEAMKGLSRAEREALAGESGPWWAQAAWEAERATVPGEGHRGRIDPAGVDRFAARLEQRLGVRPPAWWVAALRGGVVYLDTGVVFYDVMPTLAARYSVEVKRGGGSIRLAPGARLDDVPDAALAANLGQATHAEVLRDAGGVTVAAFSAGSGGFPFPVRRFAAGKLVWEATACSAGRTLLGGVGTLVVEMLAARGQILVFSAESHGVALDALDAERGAATLRFSSDFWMARQGN